MLAGKAGTGAVMTERGANMPMTVERNRDADTRAADGQSPFSAALRQRTGQGIGKVRIIDGLRPGRAEVEHGVSKLLQLLFEADFKSKPA